MKNTQSYSLTKEAWQQSAENIKKVAPLIANILLKQGGKQGKTDAEEFMTDMQLAYTAMMHVSVTAPEKCKFILVPD